MNKKNIFVSITFSRLRKNEFRNLVNQVVEFLAQQNLQSLDLQFVYDLMKRAQAILRLMKVPAIASKETAELMEKKDKRKSLIRTLVGQVRLLKRTNEVYSIPQLEIVSSFVETYLNPIVQSDSQKQTDILEEMFGEMEGDTELNEAISNLNLKTSFDALKLLQDGFVQTFIQRSNLQSVVQRVNTVDVKSEATIALTKLMYEIELMQMKHSDVDYNPLINNLNQTFTLYMSQIKARQTSKKQIVAKSKVSTIQTTTTAQNGNSGAVAVVQ